MPYDLERRLNALRAERVELRQTIKRLEQNIAITLGGGQCLELRQALHHARMRLRSSDREWCELNTLLGQPPRAPVQLGQHANVRRAAPVAMPYFTRDLSVEMKRRWSGR